MLAPFTLPMQSKQFQEKRIKILINVIGPSVPASVLCDFIKETSMEKEDSEEIAIGRKER